MDKLKPVAYMDMNGKLVTSRAAQSISPEDMAEFELQPLYALPEGYVIVPVEPTDKQLNSARDWSYDRYGKPIGNNAATGCYSAMLKAAQEEG